MSYTRLRYHLVWATRGRSPVITPALEDVIYPALHNKAREHEARLLKIGGVQDHVHLVAAVRPMLALSTFVREVKTASSRAVNTSGLLEGRFHWQRGYGAFTLNPLDLSGLLRYVANQKRHHAEGTVRAAYERLR